MKYLTRIFDDTGGVWLSSDERLHHRLSTDMAAAELADYAVLNLGFGEIRYLRNAIRVRYRLRKVSPVALASMMYWLADHPQNRVILSIFDGEWREEITASSPQLYRRLLDLSLAAQVESSNRFARFPVRFSEITSDSPLVELHRRWGCGSLAESEKVASLSDTLFNGRFTIVEVSYPSDLIIRHAGHGYLCYDWSYLRLAHGSRFEDEPDVVYGRWVGDAHREVLRLGRPSIEDVEARIRHPGRPMKYVRYRRIILPFSVTAGGRFMITASTLTEASGPERSAAILARKPTSF
jgi:hypothetical protein